MSTSPAPIIDTPGACTRIVWRSSGEFPGSTSDRIATEVPVALSYNGMPFVVMMATPDDLKDFAVGFSLSEGIVDDPRAAQLESIDHWLEGVSIAIRVPDTHMDRLRLRRRNLQGRSGCGICGSESIEAVLRAPRRVTASHGISPRALSVALAELRERQPLNAQTGATHAAAWSDPSGKIVHSREDIGRHNALDKLIGALARSSMIGTPGFAVVTSRASYEMVMKAAQARMPLLAAISAPTSLAISLADSAGITLVGFARDNGHVVYSHPGRLSPGEAPP